MNEKVDYAVRLDEWEKFKFFVKTNKENCQYGIYDSEDGSLRLLRYDHSNPNRNDKLIYLAP